MSRTITAKNYHERTKHSPASVRSGPGLNFDNKPRPYKIYTDLEQVPLPDSPPNPEPPALNAIAIAQTEPSADDLLVEPEEPQLDRETLAQLCYYAAGVTKERKLGNRTVGFRAASCTGALYHIDLYPVVGDLPDLDAGVYHFDPRTNSLDVLREGDYRGVVAAAANHDGVGEAPVTFITTSTWWRNAWKYRERTFRHAFWDSGTVVANLLAVAHANGLPASVVLGFADEPLVDLIGVDPTQEAPLELIPVGAGEEVPSPQDVESIDPQTESLSPNPKTYDVIHRAWRAGTLSDGEAAAKWRRDACEAAPVGVRDGGTGERVQLDPVDKNTASARPLGHTIVRRGSSREFEREPISFRQLSTILDRAVRGVPMDVREPDGSALQYTDCHLIVNAVDGLNSGLYQYHPTENGLERLQRGDFREEAGHLALDQQLGADAAVCVYFTTAIESLTDALGDRGYRVAQFEAAATAGRLYLATYAHRSLGGTGLTFYDDHVTELFSPRTASQTPMFLYTIGKPT